VGPRAAGQAAAVPAGDLAAPSAATAAAGPSGRPARRASAAGSGRARSAAGTSGTSGSRSTPGAAGTRGTTRPTDTAGTHRPAAGLSQAVTWCTKHHRQSSSGSADCITGWVVSRKCAVACRPTDESQHAMFWHSRQIRSETQVRPSSTHR